MAHSRVLAAAAAAAALGTALAAPADADCTLTVSPGAPRALHDARDRVRRHLAATAADTSDVVVCLQPGRYDLGGEPLVFSGAAGDGVAPGSGRAVVWRSVVHGAATVSGGVQVTGWAPTTLGGGAVYVAPVPASAGFPAGAAVRQLWVAGSRASRVVVPASTALGGGLTQWVAPDGSAAGFLAPSLPAGMLGAANVELTWPIVVHNWQAPRCTAASIAPAAGGGGGGNVTLMSPCGPLLAKQSGGTLPLPVNVEAAPLFPLAPGVFYHDVRAGQLYYALAPGQTPADLASSAFTSGQEVLVEYANVTSHVWTGITFAYSTWFQPGSPDGYVDEQSTVFSCTAATPGCAVGTADDSGAPGALASGYMEPLGAVRVTSSNDVSFVGCTFRAVGAPWAFSAGGGSQGVTVAGCTFTDLSGGFLKVGSVGTGAAGSTDPSRWDAYASLHDNVADNMALEFDGAAGLFGGLLWGAVIDHNTVNGSGYTGISVGWGWGSGAVAPGTGNLTVTNNRLINIMRLLRDGGGVYLNGFNAGTGLVAGNFVDGDPASTAALYFDNGASNWTCAGNVVAQAAAYAAYEQGCCNLPAYNVTVRDLWYDSATKDPINECAPQGCVLDESTIFKVPTGQPWPPAAQAIVDAAGARPARHGARAVAAWEAERRARTRQLVVAEAPRATAAAACRDRWLQPFSSTSIWNTAIGSGAVFAPAHIYDADFFAQGGLGCHLRVRGMSSRRTRCPGLPLNATQAACEAAPAVCCYLADVPAGTPTCFLPAGLPPYESGFHPDEDLLIVASADDPETPFLDRAWVGEPHCCDLSGPQRGTLPFPVNYTTDCHLNNNAAALLMPDNVTLMQFQPLYRGSPGSPIMAQWPPTTPYPFWAGWNISIEGEGLWGAHGGSFLSSIGGTIRAGEMLPDAPPIAHALKLELFAVDYYWAGFGGYPCYVWPALACDGYARGGGPQSYNGSLNFLVPGALLAIPSAVAPTVNVSTVPGKRLLDALVTYGGYIVDDTAGDSAAICMEPPAMADMNAAYGIPFNITTSATAYGPNSASVAFFWDLVALFRALHVVTNNAPSAIGGGGTPLAPPAPPLCPL